ncbi:MAG: hypothetical protein M3Y48_07760 [Actinomycetota bacterium]|nr:hypothetical protein [Actinomycetota bacterium]
MVDEIAEGVVGARVSGFGTYVTTLAIRVLVVLTLHEGAAGWGWSIRRAGFVVGAPAGGFLVVAATLGLSRFRSARFTEALSAQS